MSPPDDDTKPIPRVTLLALLAELKQSIDSGFTEVRTDLESVKNEGQRTNMRLTRLEMRTDDVEQRLSHNSDRVKQDSEHDLDRDAQLAKEIGAREALAVQVGGLVTKTDALVSSQSLQTEILKRVDRFFDLCDRIRKHPVTKLVLAIATLLLGGYAASKGLKLQ